MLNDFQQKKRNRPLPITDIAISKVKRTRIFGFNDKENEFVQKQHQRLLNISKEDTNSEEVAIVIDIIHWNSEVVIGKGNRVSMGINPKANMMLLGSPKNTLLVMHNHPSTSTFSGEDFKMFCDNESIFIITIVGNDGSVQVMEKTSNFDGQLEKIKYGNVARKYKENGYKNNGTMAMKYLVKHPEEFDILYKHGGKKR